MVVREAAGAEEWGGADVFLVEVFSDVRGEGWAELGGAVDVEAEGPVGFDHCEGGGEEEHFFDGGAGCLLALGLGGVVCRVLSARFRGGEVSVLVCWLWMPSPMGQTLLVALSGRSLLERGLKCFLLERDLGDLSWPL